LGREAFRRFVAAIDRPTEEMPTLARYAREQSPIPARSPAGRRGPSRRSVMIMARSSSILGLRCLTGGCTSRLGLPLRPSSVSRKGAPPRMRREMPDPVPVVLLARLALDRTEKGQGVATVAS
jgi:hypothetical protein